MVKKLLIALLVLLSISFTAYGQTTNTTRTAAIDGRKRDFRAGSAPTSDVRSAT